MSGNKRFVVAVLVIALVAAVAALRAPLWRWFAGPGGEDPHAEHAAPPGAHRFGPARGPMEEALSASERIREALAGDGLQGVPAQASAVEKALVEAATRGPEAPPHVLAAIARAEHAARALGQAQDVEKARDLYGQLSEPLVSLALVDPSLVKGWSLFECPMARGYGRWLQPDAKMANPYMGTRMLQCGSVLDLEAEARAHAPAAGGEDVAFYTCPMHPSVRQAGPGQCPLCGMDLVPVARRDLETGAVTVDEGRRQRIGVKVEEVRLAPLEVTVRAAGQVRYDETGLTDINVQVAGFVRELKVDAVGRSVKKGELLFRLYSPELLAAQTEYLVALRARGDAGDPLVQAARARLSLWGVDDAFLKALAQRGEPLETVPFRSPAAGVVVEKMVVDGAAVEPGMRLYRLARVDRVWVEAQVFEAHQAEVKVGMPAEVHLPFAPGKPFTGKVSWVAPYLDPKTRTVTVRVELPNPDGDLKPEMYVDVVLRLSRGERLQVPVAAVVYTGPRRLVFVDEGQGRLVPREVTLGLRGEGHFEVREGLAEGDRVVTSGNFLIAAESRLRSATRYWGDDHGGH